MTNKTRALGHRLLGSLKNENVIVVTSASTKTVQLVNARTNKTFALVYENEHGHVLHWADGSAEHGFTGLVGAIRALPGYPAPKVRKGVVRGVTCAPKFLAVKVG